MLEFKWNETFGIDVIETSGPTGSSLERRHARVQLSDGVDALVGFGITNTHPTVPVSVHVIVYELIINGVVFDYDDLNAMGFSLVIKVIKAAGIQPKIVKNAVGTKSVDLVPAIVSTQKINDMLRDNFENFLLDGVNKGETEFVLSGFGITLRVLFTQKIGRHTVSMIGFECDTDDDGKSYGVASNESRIFLVHNESMVSRESRMAQALIRRYNASANIFGSRLQTLEDTKSASFRNDFQPAVRIAFREKVECRNDCDDIWSEAAAMIQMGEYKTIITADTLMSTASDPEAKYAINGYIKQPGMKPEYKLVFHESVEEQSVRGLYQSVSRCADAMRAEVSCLNHEKIMLHQSGR